MGTQSDFPISQYRVFLPSFDELLLSVDLPSAGPFSLPADPSPGVTQQTSNIALGLSKKQKNVLVQGASERHRDVTTIDTLPDDVLLEIFAVFQMNSEYLDREWHLLVHVCRRWRRVVFASPLRLDLRILCTDGTPVRENLGIWPRLPIVVRYGCLNLRCIAPDDEDNVIAALGHPDLVSSLHLRVADSQMEKIAIEPEMQEPFPELTSLYIRVPSLDRNPPVLPTKFLGGSAPRLESIELWNIPFPALPILLLSASDLTLLELRDIPPTGYFSPEAMVVSLAALPRLRSFAIKFQLATPRPDRMRPPPLTRTVLPALKDFQFRGASEYLEDLVCQIDSPQLFEIEVTYLNQLVDFQVSQLSKFIDRSVGLMLTLFGHADVYFHKDLGVTFNVRYKGNENWNLVRTNIRCKGIDWQVSHMAQVLSQFPATLSTLQNLKLSAEFQGPTLGGMDDANWQLFLLQFSAVKTLHVSHWQGLAKHVALALENSTGGVFAEALPSLDLIYLAGQSESSIEKFVALRQLSGNYVTVIDTEAEFEERLKSYVRDQREDWHCYVPEWL